MSRNTAAHYSWAAFTFLVLTFAVGNCNTYANTSALRLLGQLDVIAEMQPGITWAQKRIVLDLETVTAEKVGLKLISATGKDLKRNTQFDVVLARRSKIKELLALNMLASLDDIAPNVFTYPQVRTSDLFLWEGKVRAVCFGDYNYPFATRPCMAVVAATDQPTDAAKLLAYIYSGQPEAMETPKGEAQRALEACLTSLFIDHDYPTAWRFIYADPSYHEHAWTQKSFYDMTTKWDYSSVPGYRVVVYSNEAVFETDYPKYQGTVLRIEALVEWLQSPGTPSLRDMFRLPSGKYYLGRTFIIRMVQQGHEWKVLSRPYSLFD